jgi:hypothetical protein
MKYGTLGLILSFCSYAGYNKISSKISTPEGMKIEVRNNKCRLLAPDGKVLLEMEADGTSFTVNSVSTAFGTHVQGNRVRVIDEDGTTTLCDMDYNGKIITVTNIHGLKVSDVDIKLHMDKKTGTLAGISIPKL